MWRWLKAAVVVPFRLHLPMSLLIVGFVSAVISAQISDRTSFAGGELRRDVMDRWGAPISQSAPSVRYVASGAVFNTLGAMVLDKQEVSVQTTMNYRKRGLVYFSGFDFDFHGRYEVANGEGHAIDLVFVFPIQAQKNQVLLSDLVLLVNGAQAPVDLAGDNDRLVWTGRAQPQERLRFEISFRGRGLDSFVYTLDPSLPVRGFDFTFTANGGVNYDYPAGVVPAGEVVAEGGKAALRWRYGSLESGIPVGLILPSEQSWDSTLGTMVRRCWAPFIPFFLATAALALYHRRPLKAWQSYLLAAWYGLFFLLLSYLAAYSHFYAAYAVSTAVVIGTLVVYLRALIGRSTWPVQLAICGAFLVLPTLAVLFQGYTGLIYTLELVACLGGLMVFTTREAFRRLVENVLSLVFNEEVPHVS